MIWKRLEPIVVVLAIGMAIMLAALPLLTVTGAWPHIVSPRDCGAYGEPWSYECNARFAQLLQGWSAFASVGMTAIGIVLIGFTLHYTRAAAKAAEGALREATATTAAARAQLESQMHTEVAFLYVVGVHPKGPAPGHFGFGFALRNVGRTPAIIKAITLSTIVVDQEGTDADEQEIGRTSPNRVLAAGAEDTIQVSTNEPLSAYPQKMVVRVIYVDVYGAERYRGFILSGDGMHPPDQIGWQDTGRLTSEQAGVRHTPNGPPDP